MSVMTLLADTERRCEKGTKPLDQFIAPFVGLTSKHEPLLPGHDVLHVAHRYQQDAATEQPATNDERVRPFETCLESHFFNDAESPRGRVDAEALTTAEPIIGIPGQRSGKFEGARHETPLAPENDRCCSVEGVGARCWSTVLLRHPGTTTSRCGNQRVARLQRLRRAIHIKLRLLDVYAVRCSATACNRSRICSASSPRSSSRGSSERLLKPKTRSNSGVVR